MWAQTLTLQSMATIAATVRGVVVTPMTAKSENPVDAKKRVAPIILYGDAENQVEYHAHGKEADEVGYGIDMLLTAQVIDDGYCYYEDQPNTREKGHYGVGLAKGVEGRMEEVFLPCLRGHILDCTIDCSRNAHGEAKEGGVEASDIVEMDYKEAFFAEALDDEKEGCSNEGGKEEEEAVVAELRDKT